MIFRDLDIDYDQDLVKSVSFKKGQSERPLWAVIESFGAHQVDQMINWVGRLDSLCPVASEWALAQALEHAAGVNLPVRAQFVRSIFSEINRLVYLTTYLSEILKAAGVPLAYQKILILRENVFQKQEELMGGRILPQVFKLGGVRRDLALGDIQKVEQFIYSWRRGWDEWQALVDSDDIFMSRLDGLLRLPQAEIRKKGLWGILGKASGLFYDTRIHRPHGAYPLIDFKLDYDSTLEAQLFGDASSRYLVAVKEVQIALAATQSLLKNIPQDGMVAGATVPPIAVVNAHKLSPGFYSGSSESAKGPVTAVVEVDEDGRVRTTRVFNVAQRIWPEIESYFVGLKAEDFYLAWASLGMTGEEAEI